GGVRASIQSQSQTTIEVRMPAGRQAGPADVVVTSPQGSDRAVGAYTYQEADPQDDDRISVTGVSPTSGPMSGGTSITVSGSRLDLVTGANMGGKPARIVSQSATSITVVSPSADGAYGVNIVLENGKGGVEAGRFQYTP
ncbi:MAG: IPT/TIG domain-containing protein, partial [Actinomycetales bacterium]